MTQAAELTTFQVEFSKLGEARFLSHLDLSRSMEFALRRCRVPMAFSSGFHPRPKIHFESALPLGWESERECMWLDFEADYPCRELHGRLEQTVPSCLNILRVQRVGKRSNSSETRIYQVEGLCVKNEAHSQLAAFGKSQSGEPCAEFCQKDGAQIFTLRSPAPKEEPPSLKKVLKALYEGEVPENFRVTRLVEPRQ